METFPFFEQQKLDYPSVSLLIRGVHLFQEFRRAITIPCILYMKDEESIHNW